LSVSESILRAMGGRILCRSHEGRGTIFIVMLPRRVPSERPET
jgi:signal transduction histidine kinase